MYIASAGFGLRVDILLDKTLSCGSNNIFLSYAYTAVSSLIFVFQLLIMILMACATLAVAEIWTSGSEVLEPPRISKKSSESQSTAYDHHATLSIKYKETGEMVKSLKEAFELYFPLPWIFFFIVTAVQSQVKLFSSEQDQEGVTADVVFQRITFVVLFYLSYIIQLYSLFVLAVSMNQNHKHFLKAMREKQLEYDIEKKENPDMEEAEHTFIKACHGYARTLQIEREEDYDFVPRIVFLDIKVGVNDSTYVIFLLISGLIGVAGSLI